MSNKKKLEKQQVLYQYIYGIFEPFEASFLDGEYNVHANGKIYQLTSTKVAILRNDAFEAFEELLPFLDFLKVLPDFVKHTTPNEHLTIIDYDFYKKALSDFTTDVSLIKKIQFIVKHYYQCLSVKIEHSYTGKPFDYLNNINDNGDRDKAANIFLRAIREFQDYHILAESPYVYLSDVHFRKTEGMYSYCSDSNGKVFTKTRPMLDCWTPKKADDAQEKARVYFDSGNQYDIAEMLMARARAYSEQKSSRLAILHAVMSLEVIVPKVTNLYLKHNSVSRATIDDFDKKFGLSVRVKAFLKIIFPIASAHAVIDKVGETIALRNKIVHEGLQETSFDSKHTEELINNCYILKKILDIYMTEKQ